MTVLTGSRQCVKTTLVRELVPEDSANCIDLEDPASLARMDHPWQHSARCKICL